MRSRGRPPAALILPLNFDVRRQGDCTLAHQGRQPHRPEIIALLQEHLDEMRSVSPPESVHALDLSSLRRPDITFGVGGWDLI